MSRLLLDPAGLGWVSRRTVAARRSRPGRRGRPAAAVGDDAQQGFARDQHLLPVAAQGPAGTGERRGPDQAAGGGPEQERAEGHQFDAGRHGNQGADGGNQAAPEHHGGAVALKPAAGDGVPSRPASTTSNTLSLPWAT